MCVCVCGYVCVCMWRFFVGVYFTLYLQGVQLFTIIFFVKIILLQKIKLRRKQTELLYEKKNEKKEKNNKKFKFEI